MAFWSENAKATLGAATAAERSQLRHMSHGDLIAGVVGVQCQIDDMRRLLLAIAMGLENSGVLGREGGEAIRLALVPLVSIELKRLAAAGDKEAIAALNCAETV